MPACVDRFDQRALSAIHKPREVYAQTLDLTDRAAVFRQHGAKDLTAGIQMGKTVARIRRELAFIHERPVRVCERYDGFCPADIKGSNKHGSHLCYAYSR